MTAGGIWLPGHDARAASKVGRLLAAVSVHRDLAALAAEARERLRADASEELCFQAARIALNAIEKAAA
ncbi:hypothetical protein H7J07_04360 [Mycobacterium koreense]|uniref:Uncharacterized protein n=1 Tax=Mycolicibacillus koreensis TaxID=1069220 RepID=A0AA91PCM6_9MYCO|nr:hypothetical protein [Mycolicibacillus koreensis]MCV7247488.1 hypothetical protein [Mycolicibacillus koreensis]OSC27597.1 hypothetical protein B8W67_18040 [Mycolicibacillus koreensis]